MSYRTIGSGVYFDKVSQYGVEHNLLTFKDIIEREHISLVMCNNLPEVCEQLNDYSIWDNMDKGLYDEENEEYEEIFQWYLTDISEWTYKWLKKTYGDNLLFTYCDSLDCYVLCVTHFGTSWDCVLTDIQIEEDKNRE